MSALSGKKIIVSSEYLSKIFAVERGLRSLSCIRYKTGLIFQNAGRNAKVNNFWL